MKAMTGKSKKEIAKERGERLRQFRERTGLPRAYFEEKFGISQSSIRAWEVGVNALSEKKAAHLARIFTFLGVKVGVKDLMYGEELTQPPKPQDRRENFLDQAAQIYLEIDFFKKNVFNYSLLKVPDLCMYPHFLEGDMVGGIKTHFQPDILGKFCIIETEKGDRKLRKIIENKHENIFLVGLTNMDEKTSEPPLEEIHLEAMAPVTRIWRLRSCLA